MFFENKKKSGGGPIESMEMMHEGKLIITFKDVAGNIDYCKIMLKC